MGFLTTITIHNDALHEFEKNPEMFGKAILKGILDANREHNAVDVAFKGYCNYITVQPSRHADDHTAYIHYGNTVFDINPYGNDMRTAIEGNPEFAKDVVKVADGIVKDARRAMKLAAARCVKA